MVTGLYPTSNFLRGRPANLMSRAAPPNFRIQGCTVADRKYIVRIMAYPGIIDFTFPVVPVIGVSPEGRAKNRFIAHHPSPAGHIFAAWGEVINFGEPLMEPSIGFGPKGGYHLGWESSADGELWKGDRNGPSEFSKDYAVGYKNWVSSKEAINTFDSKSYSCPNHDCVSFVITIARAAGLSFGWLRQFDWTPVGTFEAIEYNNRKLIYTVKTH